MSTNDQPVSTARSDAAVPCASSDAATEQTTLIEPLARPLTGAVRVPGDKSISHRSVLFSAMAEGTSHVSGVLDSADVRSSIGAVRALGAEVNVEKQPDGSLTGDIRGWGSAGPSQPTGAIDCGNSGTTVRLLMGVLAPWDITVELTGDASLRRRPMRRIAAPLEMMGARFAPEGATTLPLSISGTRDLAAISYDSPIASAQLKTAILLAGIFASGTTGVYEPAPSRNHTELMLPGFGVAVESAPGEAFVRGGQSFHACDVDVPGDPSSAAFMACAAALRPGSSIDIENVSLNEARIGFVRVLERMGAAISVKPTGSAGEEPCGTISVSHVEHLRACEVMGREIASLVDEIPVLALVAAHAEGTTVFHEVGELRVKETDRLAAIVEGLGKLGVHAWAEGDDLHIEGVPGLVAPAGLAFDSLGDHRLAMTWSLVGFTGTHPVSIRDFEAVRVSYPGFRADIERLAK
ncbi:3-phosphoshikimate 1-carboxyvinyltransferase [uncultured Ellagibacter sp.]|uniref:3-phosphoshikimate 1-carboxyvinyltransferase n=1 Tax=uncultured Ellagibacter sp. TaxID=2137580 RepID=UPI00261705C3|nr:3-phosphoshikimate 1-carboxyvinyltransferase [uncultured Ellagibacter sp.]